MSLDKSKVEELVALVNKRFPNWAGFSDPAFERDEVDYKQQTIDKARQLLSQNELDRLMTDENYEEIMERISKIGKDNNLLWNQVPLRGDLSILYDSNLDKATFSNAFCKLLYGPDPSPERLGHYIQYLKEHKLSNKWTFPTYFLFMCHPDSEMFAKPRAMRRFLKLVDRLDVYTSEPTPEGYKGFLDVATEIRHAFQSFNPRDMVDIQGLIWVLASVVRDKDLAGDEDVSTAIELILGSYVKTRESERFGSTGAIPDAFVTLETLLAASTPVQARPSLKVVASYGRGNWANVPWVAFLAGC